MKIIITGATGAFGGAMVRYFHERGHEIIATGRKPSPPEELTNCANYIRADITKPFRLPEADLCIHAAALSDDKAKTKELYGPNIEGTRNVVRAARETGTFVFISSSSVYLPHERPITEEMAGKQNNRRLSPYGKSKLLSEQVLKDSQNGNRCFILRARAFYGPGDTQIIPRMMKLVNKGVFRRPGSLDNRVSMTHFRNMGQAIECCMDSPLKGIHTYNVADNRVYVAVDVLRELFRTIYGQSLPEKEIPMALLKFLSAFRIGGFTPLIVRALSRDMVLDLSRIREELGYRPEVEFTESLDELREWIRSIGGPGILQKGGSGLAWK